MGLYTVRVASVKHVCYPSKAFRFLLILRRPYPGASTSAGPQSGCHHHSPCEPVAKIFSCSLASNVLMATDLNGPAFHHLDDLEDHLAPGNLILLS